MNNKCLVISELLILRENSAATSDDLDPAPMALQRVLQHF